MRKVHHKDLIAVDKGRVGLEDQIAHEREEFVCASANERRKKRDWMRMTRPHKREKKKKIEGDKHNKLISGDHGIESKVMIRDALVDVPSSFLETGRFLKRCLEIWKLFQFLNGVVIRRIERLNSHRTCLCVCCGLKVDQK